MPPCLWRCLVISLQRSTVPTTVQACWSGFIVARSFKSGSLGA
ncbi:Unknown protein sequence [Pseudomonas syringae pv. maculicola]|nr:Unknown protein sequence [Pseudomonas syringae pv. maculicola]